jgi:hypothetical protein
MVRTVQLYAIAYNWVQYTSLETIYTLPRCLWLRRVPSILRLLCPLLAI